MRSKIESVVNELKRLKQEGVEGIYVSDSTMAGLRASVGTGSASAAPSNPTAESSATQAVPKKRAQMGESLESLVKKGPMETAAKKATAKAALNQHGNPVAAIPDTPPEVNFHEGDKQAQWEALKEQVLNDPVCQEHLNPGAQVVFGVGSVDADIFFCGEAPGGDEEKQGEPFVGKAGALLTKIITAMGLSR